MHFLGIDWRDRKPYLVFRKNLKNSVEKVVSLESGNTFTIEVKDKKYCTGYRDTSLKETFTCTGTKTVFKKEFHQCFECRSHETIHFFAVQSLNDEQTNILRTKNHFCYLNLFGYDIVKVGVATEQGKWRRVLEQGSDSTLFFAETDGIAAREIENFVSKNFPIRQAVTYAQKMKLLKEFIPEHEAKSKLLQIFFDIKLSIPKEYQVCLSDVPEFSYNQKYYQLLIPDNFDNVLYIENIHRGDAFSGQIIGIPGQVLLYENEGKFYALNTNKLKGFIVDYSNTSSINNTSFQNKTISYTKIKKFPKKKAIEDSFLF